MSANSRSWVEEVDVDQLRTDPEKLHRVVENLKHELLKSYDQLETIHREQVRAASPVPPPIPDSSSHWPGWSWVPAETSYPSDDACRFSCLRERHIEVLVYDCKTDKIEVRRGLDKLYSELNVYTLAGLATDNYHRPESSFHKASIQTRRRTEGMHRANPPESGKEHTEVSGHREAGPQGHGQPSSGPLKGRFVIHEVENSNGSYQVDLHSERLQSALEF